MARRPAFIPIFSDEVDRAIERVLYAIAAVCLTSIVLIQIWRWMK